MVNGGSYHRLTRKTEGFDVSENSQDKLDVLARAGSPHQNSSMFSFCSSISCCINCKYNRAPIVIGSSVGSFKSYWQHHVGLAEVGSVGCTSQNTKAKTLPADICIFGHWSLVTLDGFHLLLSTQLTVDLTPE